MKAFTKGFLKGVIGCGCLVLLAAVILYFTGGLKSEKELEAGKTVTAKEPKEETKPDEEANIKTETASLESAEEAHSKDVSEYAKEDTVTEPEEEKAEIRMLFAGDVYLPESHQSMYSQDGITALTEEALLEEMVNADLFVINQEFPFGTTGTPAEDKQFTFRIHPEYVSAELDMGVDLVTLANNHVLDFGREPLSETLAVLEEAGISYVGAGENIQEAGACKTFELGGKVIGFLGASRVIPVTDWNAGNHVSGVLTTYDPTRLVEEIKKAKENCDFVVVYVHWGIERNTIPEEYQRNLGKIYIDAGADAVIGSHPHVVQGVEYYNGKPIVYSLGNYIFNLKTYETMLAELTLSGENCTLRLIPCISEAGQVRLQEDSSAFLSMMETLSFDVEISEDGTVVP